MPNEDFFRLGAPRNAELATLEWLTVWAREIETKIREQDERIKELERYIDNLPTGYNP